MSRPAIAVEHLAKAYRIGLEEQQHDTLIGSVIAAARYPFRNFHRLRRLNTFRHCDESDDMFWALRDISFDVAEGEVVGIIGRNGAGKSTLLKVLSRITEPTSGRAVIRGRVSSLLEVGTGFHQELTGRENVYMNGTILGMTKREIDRKFDEIVDFSGVEKFLDTPIKHYSSGMKVRLAFAVAAHLEPEILIVDEVLAVGDVEFQRKCLGKMHDVARCGRTVLFVSHNMAAVENLCSTGVVLNCGSILYHGVVDDAVAAYLADSSTNCISPMRRANGTHEIVEEVNVFESDSANTGRIRCGSDATFRIRFASPAPLQHVRIGLRIDSLGGAPVTHIQSEIATGRLYDLPARGEVNCILRNLPLLPGRYSLAVAVFSKGVNIDMLSPAIEFDVERGDFFRTGRLPKNSLGSFLVNSEWQVTNGHVSADMQFVDEECR